MVTRHVRRQVAVRQLALRWRPAEVVVAVALSFASGGCASSAAHHSRASAPASASGGTIRDDGGAWADSVLATLSLRDKAAQLVWPMVMGDYVAANEPAFQRSLRYITVDHVGGFIASVGSPIEIASKLNALQQRSTLPLLVAADLEFGAGYRARGGYFLPNVIELGSATVFPPEMGIGATRDTAIAYEQGRITAIEGRALGIHIAFAPVLDVNNNPANPVIGVRSFGEDPRLDAALGAAEARGMQDHGMMATGKHFPGHGDTDQNSHLTLPTINVSRARMDTVELVPFRVAIAAGVGGIMTAHISLPAVIGDSSTPATLSPRIMTDLLRQQLGFQGVLFTDALDMNGVLANVRGKSTGQVIAGTYGIINSVGLPEVVKRAVEAGADVLLMPSDVPGAIDAVVAGVQERRFTEARVGASARKLLALKARLGLPGRRLVPLDSVRLVVGDTANLAAARVAAERSITLAKDALHLVPLSREPNRVLSVTIAPRADLGAGRTFDAELRRVFPALRTDYVNPDDPGADFGRVLAEADSAQVVLVSSYVSQSYTSANALAPNAFVEFLHESVRRTPRMILVNFGNPYLLQRVPEVSTYVVAWGGLPVSQRAAAMALVGATAISGRLPIRIPPVLPFGAGEDRAGGIPIAVHAPLPATP